MLVEVAALAVLSDDVAIIDAGMDIEAADDVRVVKELEDGDFAVEQAPSDFALDLANADFLNCHSGVARDVGAAEDLAETALSDLLRQIEHVVLDLLDRCHALALGFAHNTPKRLSLNY